MRRIFISAIYIFFIILLSSCQSSDQQKHVKDMPPNKVDNKIIKEHPAQLRSLEVDNENFVMVSDWFDDKTLLYVMNSINGQDIHTFNVFTGQSKLFYSSKNPIVKVTANTNNELFLIQTAPTTYEAELIVINKAGKEVFTWKIGSNELLVTWNPYIQDQFFVTTFLVDWTFQTYLINVKSKEILENEVPIPFIQWVGNASVAYLKWNEEEPAFSAPLYKVNLGTKKETKMFENISFFTTFSNNLLTIKTDENSGNAIYSFYDIDTLQQKGEFRAPLLAKYSDWFIPNYDTNSHLFYTFKPYQTEAYDQYQGKYDLITYSVKTGTEKVILTNVNHMPIKLSPNGKLCLYGYYFEQVIEIENERVFLLINLN